MNTTSIIRLIASTDWRQKPVNLPRQRLSGLGKGGGRAKKPKRDLMEVVYFQKTSESHGNPMVMLRAAI